MYFIILSVVFYNVLCELRLTIHKRAQLNSYPVGVAATVCATRSSRYLHKNHCKLPTNSSIL